MTYSVPLASSKSHEIAPSDSQLQTPIDIVQRSHRDRSSTHMLDEMLYGSIAGMAGKLFEYPFDTVKVRLQSQASTGSEAAATTPLACFRQAIRNDGFLSLYRGLSAPMFGAAVEVSSLFFSYDLAQWALRSHFNSASDGGTSQELSLSSKLICGGLSGAFTSILLTPIELVKCQMQMPVPSSTTLQPGTIKIIRNVFATHGISGFWHGQLGTLLRETGGSMAWFGAQSAVTEFFQRRQLLKTHPEIASEKDLLNRSKIRLNEIQIPVYQQLLAGASAGMGYNFIFYPADTIKSCMQTQGVESLTAGPYEGNPRGGANVTVSGRQGLAAAPAKSPPVRRASFLETGKRIWRTDGLKGLYRGCGITLLRSAPSSALIFYVHDLLVRVVSEWKGGALAG